MLKTDGLLTGIQEIDAQHQVLFDSFARIEHAVTGKEKWDAVHYALTELDDFVRIHFAVEESLLRLHDYPHLEAHIAEHRQFAQRLTELKQRSVRSDVAGDMVELLRKWLVQHIGKADIAYVSHLRTHPITPAA